MAQYSVFKRFNKHGDFSPEVVFSLIASNMYYEEVFWVRHYLSIDKIDSAKIYKNKLPAFSFAASFRNKRDKSEIQQINNMVCIDFDKIDPADLSAAKEKICNDPFTYACFISPSGNGLKVFAKYRPMYTNYKQIYNRIHEHYESITNLKADRLDDITRLCFFSYDPNLYSNPNSQLCFTNKSLSIW